MSQTARGEFTQSLDAKSSGEGLMSQSKTSASRLSLSQLERCGELRRANLIARGLTSDLKMVHKILVEQNLFVESRNAFVALENAKLLVEATEKEFYKTLGEG